MSMSMFGQSNNRTLVHGATQILGYATGRKVESTVSGDWKMEFDRQSPLELGVINVKVPVKCRQNVANKLFIESLF